MRNEAQGHLRVCLPYIRSVGTP